MIEGISFNDLEKWERDNPVIVPPEVQTEIERRKAEFADTELSRERWSELVEEQRKLMAGYSDRDLYYQLYVLRGTRSQGDDGVNSRRTEIERALRSCWCDSGNKYKNCHGK